MNATPLHILIAILMPILSGSFTFAHAAGNEMHFRIKASDESLDPDSRLNYIDSLIKVSPEETDSLLMLSTNLAYMTGRYRHALHSANLLLERHPDNDSRFGISHRCATLFNLAKTRFKCEDYADAIETAFKLINLHKPDSLLYYDIDCLNILYDFQSELSTHGGVPGMESDLDAFMKKAEDILAKAESKGLSKSTIDKMKKSIIFSKMTRAADTGNYQEALDLGAEMMRYSVTDIEKLALKGNMAMLYLYLGDYDMAEGYYSQILSEPAWHINHAVCLQNYMYLLIYTGRPQQAIDVMDAHPEIYDIVNGNLNYAKLLKFRSDALAAIGNYREAHSILSKAYHSADSINNSISAAYMSKLVADLGARKKLAETTALNGKLSSQIKWIAIALAICACALATTLFLFFRKNNKPSAEGSDTDIKEPDCKEIGNLTLKVLKMASISEAFSEISGMVADTKTSDKDKIEKIKAQLTEMTSFNDIWDTFLVLFEKLHPRFLHRLNATYPWLTQGETRMCAYVMMNMTNKEIAAMTRRSTRSVETMRYRLTKKMNLPEGVNLASRLHSLSTLP